MTSRLTRRGVLGMAAVLASRAGAGAAPIGGRRTLLVSRPDPVLSQFPADTAALYLFDRPVTSGSRQVVPNLKTVATRPISPNLCPVPARAFNNANIGAFANSGLTITDNSQVAPNGRTEAARMVCASGDWYLYIASVVFPAGNWTIVITAKSHDGTAWAFKQKFFTKGQTSTDRTLTNSYQRFAFPVTITSGTENLLMFACSPDGSTGVDMDVADVAHYPGLVDLEPNGRALFGGHIVLGTKPFDSRPVISGNVVDLSASGAIGVVQWEHDEAPSLAEVTVQSLTNKVVARSFNSSISWAGDFNAFDARVQFNSKQFDFVNGGISTQNGGGAFQWNSYTEPKDQGWRFITGRMPSGGGLGDVWLNKQSMYRRTVPATTTYAPDLLVVNSTGGVLVANGGNKFAALIIVPRKVTDAEVLSMQAGVGALLGTYGSITPTPPKNLCLWGGDSISANSAFPIQAMPSVTNLSDLVLYALAGTNLAQRRSDYAQSIRYCVANKAAGQKILFVSFEGRNDLSTSYVGYVNPAHTGVTAFLEDLHAFFATAKADGFMTAACTILPSTEDGTGVYNGLRNTANATILTWAGDGTVDYVWDVGNDPTMGPDSAPNDTGLYIDKTHPTASAATTYLAPSAATFLNSIF